MTTTAKKREARPEVKLKDGYYRTLPVEVDEPAVISRMGGTNRSGVMRSVSLIQRGEALGHGQWIDEITLQQVAEYANRSNKGVKSRFTHPGMSSDGLGRHLGRVRDTYVENDRVLGDLHFASSAHATPDGNLAEYVMDLAEEDPHAAGLSIVFEHDHAAEDAFVELNGGEENFESPDPDNKDNLPHVRIKTLRAADVVDEPAANPEGLFDRQDLPRQMDDLLAYASGLTDEQPNTSLGIDPERAAAFLSRWLADHHLSLVPETPEMTKETAPENPGKGHDEFVAELDQYTSTFGAERGLGWFKEGVPFDECLQRHVVELRAENDQLRSERDALQKQLDSLSLGEDEPLEVVDIPKKKASPFRFADQPADN